jgi:hypothetical protein
MQRLQECCSHWQLAAPQSRQQLAAAAAAVPAAALLLLQQQTPLLLLLPSLLCFCLFPASRCLRMTPGTGKPQLRGLDLHKP